eukprot:scaffold14781_cov113-Isochrysis_galbana.AAC.3
MVSSKLRCGVPAQWAGVKGGARPRASAGAPSLKFYSLATSSINKKNSIRCASGRMRQDTLVSSGGLASPPFPPPTRARGPGFPCRTA